MPKTSYSCKFCQKKFKHLVILRRHEKSYCPCVHPSKRRDFVCSKCGMHFKKCSNFNRHLDIHIKKKFSCKLCKEKFRKLCELRGHQKVVHSHKIYLCYFCKKGFSKSSNKKRHEQIHRGSRPFVCSCGKKFNQKSNLETHQNKIHGKYKQSYDFIIKRQPVVLLKRLKQ